MADIVERLRRDLASGLSASVGDTEEAADEIERLREALRKIRDFEPNFPVIYDGDDALDMKKIARAGLGEEEGG